MAFLYSRGCQRLARFAAYNFSTSGLPSASLLLRHSVSTKFWPLQRIFPSLFSPSNVASASSHSGVAALECVLGRLGTGRTVQTRCSSYWHLAPPFSPHRTTPFALQVPAPSPLVIVISGPSGVGKDAVIRRLQELRPDLFFVVTATSRPVRPGEQDGVDYLFVTRQQFEDWIEAGQLLEHALVYGDYKGIPKSQVEDALSRGTDVVLRLDVQGAATVRRLLPHSVSIFLVAESEYELVHRLVARKTEPLDKLMLRVETARSELQRLQEFDYVVVNQDGKLDSTVRAIEAVIQAEKARVPRLLQANDLE